MKSDYLLVYGTLLQDFDSYMSKFLTKHSEFVGQGFFYGKLYEVSWYPGAVLSNNMDEKVYGHIFEIRDHEKVFKILDAYEGIGDFFPEPNEYKRAQVTGYLGSSETDVKVWLYIYNHPTDHLKRIPSGYYLK